jgi:site-specific DNA recombinase
MPNTNGHGPKMAALYRRVSGEEQKQKGFSLPDQRAEALEYCVRKNLEVVREFEDAGYSGKFLERPDLDELRDLVTSGGVNVVVVSKRDRLARGLYAGYLKNEFKRRGVELIALDSITEDTPYGELLENTLDNFSEFERFMIADRMRRGKRSKAKQGKLIASPQSDYGFRYNETRDGYEVDELKMALVRRVFRMVGVEGMTLNAVGARLEAEGIPSPRGGRTWNRPTLRKFILSDVYLRHSYEEVASIVSGEVAATLDSSAHYGISWYGKQRHTHSREVRIKHGKKTYPRIKKSVDLPQEEWIGVPVPDPSIPREWVLAARHAIKDNEKVSNCGRRFWELTGGVLRCAACEGAMATNYITPRKTGYYRCGKRYRLGTHACSQGRNFRAEDTERKVWDFVSSVLKDPERLRLGVDEMLDREKALSSRTSDEDAEGWLKKLSELEVQEERLLDLYLEGKLESDRYESRVTQLKRSRMTVQEELEHIRNRTARIERLEQDRDALLNHYARIAVEHLDKLEPEERNRVYKMLDLKFLAHRDGNLEVKWALGGDPCGDNEPLPPDSSRTRGR